MKYTYRIDLNDDSLLCNTLAMIAAKSNGQKYKPLSELKIIAETLMLAVDFKANYSLRVEGSTLYIDKRINVLKPALIIQEVELWDTDNNVVLERHEDILN